MCFLGHSLQIPISPTFMIEHKGNLTPISIIINQKGQKHTAILLSFVLYPYKISSTTISSPLSILIFILCAYPKGTRDAGYKNKTVSKGQSLIKSVHDIKTVMFCFHRSGLHSCGIYYFTVLSYFTHISWFVKEFAVFFLHLKTRIQSKWTEVYLSKPTVWA